MIVKPTPTPEQLDDLDFDLDAGTVCYVAQEDDRDTDRLDILAETPPADWHRPMRRPNRDAFAMVLPTLPRHELGLHEMCVPIDTLDALVGVLAPLRGGDSGGGGADDSNNKKNNNNNNGGEGALGSLVDRARTKAAARMAVEVGACLTWEEFDEVLRVEGCTVSIPTGLFGLGKPKLKPRDTGIHGQRTRQDLLCLEASCARESGDCLTRISRMMAKWRSL